MKKNTKCCSNCGNEKSTKEFYIDNNSNDGLQSQCKNCHKIRSKKNKITPDKINWEGTKICNGPVCKGKELPMKKFSQDLKKSDGVQGYCKDCKKHNSNKKPKENENLDPEKDEKHCDGCNKKHLLKYFNKSNTGRMGYANVCREKVNEARRAKKTVAKTTGQKKCNGVKCNGKMLDVKNFAKDSSTKDGLRTYCKECYKVKMKQWDGNIKRYFKKIFNDLKKNTKNRNVKRQKRGESGILINITIDILKNLYEKSNKCAYSGKIMTHKFIEDSTSNIQNPLNISIDRIDSNKGYTEDNIRLICNIVNRMKMYLTNKQLHNYCGLVFKHMRDNIKSNNKVKIDKDLHTYLVKTLADTRCNLKKRNKKLDINIDLDFLKELYIKQNGLCAYTKQPLTHIMNTKDQKTRHIINEWNISIDRIDSTKGYTKDNICLVGCRINRMKIDMTNNEFYNICKDIYINMPVDELLEMSKMIIKQKNNKKNKKNNKIKKDLLDDDDDDEIIIVKKDKIIRKNKQNNK